MIDWLKKLPADIEAAPETDPKIEGLKHELNPGDEVLGVLPPYLRKLRTYLDLQYLKTGEESKTVVQNPQGEPDERAMNIFMDYQRALILEKLFWLELERYMTKFLDNAKLEKYALRRIGKRSEIIGFNPGHRPVRVLTPDGEGFAVDEGSDQPPRDKKKLN